MMEPMTQVNGVISIINFDDFSFKHLIEASPSIMSMGFEWGQESIVLSAERAYVINQSFIFNILFTMIKPFMYDEVIAKLYFEDSDYSNMISDLGTSKLEKRFGGIMADDTPYGRWLVEEAQKHDGYFRGKLN